MCQLELKFLCKQRCLHLVCEEIQHIIMQELGHDLHVFLNLSHLCTNLQED